MAPGDWPSFPQAPDAASGRIRQCCSGRIPNVGFRAACRSRDCGATGAAVLTRSAGAYQPQRAGRCRSDRGDEARGSTTGAAAKLLPRAPTVFVCAHCSRRSRASWHALFVTAFIHWVELIPVACPEAVHRRRIVYCVDPVCCCMLLSAAITHASRRRAQLATARACSALCCSGGTEDRAAEAASARASRRGCGRRAARGGLVLRQAPRALRSLRCA